MRPIVLKYGLIAGGIMAGMFLLTMPFHDQIGFGATGMAIGYAGMVLAFLMMHVGVRTYRDSVAGGTVTYGEALRVGLLIALIAMTIYVAMWLVVSYTMMPDFMTQYGEYAVAQARAEGKGAAEIEAITKEMAAFAKSYENPLVRIAYTYLEPLPVALPFALVSAWLVSRRKGVAMPGAPAGAVR